MPPLTEPLRFERHPLEKVWGGRSLERCFGFDLPPDVPVGETWELADRENLSSVVAEGEHRGRTLGELLDEYPAEILGDAPAAANGRFPLLVKYLDASRSLSVQVHPDDETARRLGGGAEGKTEAWYVVDAEPGSALFVGLRPEIGREELARIATGPEVEAALLRWEVRRGDCLLLPGGTVHAIGAGVTVLEVQQNSDTTFRLYDWGRAGLDGKPRATHVELALASLHYHRETPPPTRVRWECDTAAVPLVNSPHFCMKSLSLTRPMELGATGSYRILTAISGKGDLFVPGSETRLNLHGGDVWLVPAACPLLRIEPAESELRLVEMTRGNQDEAEEVSGREARAEE